MSLAAHRHFLVVLLVLALALFARLHRIGAESFWIDEIISAQTIEGPYGAIVGKLPPDKPPLEYYVQAFFSKLKLGEPEVWHRVPAALFSLLAVAGVYFWARGWFGRRTALLAILLAAGNGFLIRYAHEARPYSMFTALAVWQQALFSAWWRSSMGLAKAENPEAPAGGRWGLYAGLLAASVGAIYTLYAAFLIFAAQAAFLLLAPLLGGGLSVRQRVRVGLRVLGPYLLLVAVVVLAILPMRTRSALVPEEGYFWKFQEEGALFLWRYIFAEFSFFGLPSQWALAVALCVHILLMLAFIGYWRNHRAALLQIGLSSFAIIPITLAIYSAIDHLYTGRYLIFCVPGLCVLFALGLQALAGIPARLGLRLPWPPERAAFALGGAYALAGAILYFAGMPYRNDIRGAAAHLAKHAEPGEAVVVPAGEDSRSFRYYLKRMGREDLRIEPQRSVADQPDTGSTWKVILLMNEEARQSPIRGYRFERVGRAPQPDDFARLSEALGPYARLSLGDCPPALLDAGWSGAEVWNPETAIRYATRRRSGVYLPVRRAGAGRLTVRAYPYSYDDAPSQTVRLKVKETLFSAHPLPAGAFTEIAWDLPEGLLRRGFNYVELEFAYAGSPGMVRKNYGDFRMLAAAVQWIQWRSNPAVSR